jgi:glycosyltransferase involved in cell wall biosynthesis
MKILFLTRHLHYGGAERQLIVLARGLHQRGHEVAVAVFYPEGVLEADLKADGIPVLSLEKRGRWDVFGFLWRLIRLVRQERPDVLHSYIANLMTVVLHPFCPSIKMVWGLRCAELDFGQYDWLTRLGRRLDRLCSNSPDLIISNSYAAKLQCVSEGYSADKICVIPNGIDTDRFAPDPEARQRIRAAWGIADSHCLVGIVGRLELRKDHETFLRAAALAVRKRSNLRFVCIGDGPEDVRTKLQQRAQFLRLSDHMLWVAGQSQIWDAYNALDLLVNCSVGEGFANVIGEAMACGVPCVVTNVGDSGFVIGNRGGIVPPKEPRALCAAMLRMFERERPSPEAVRNRIVEEYSVDKLVASTESELLSLLPHKHGERPTSSEYRVA